MKTVLRRVSPAIFLLAGIGIAMWAFGATSVPKFFQNDSVADATKVNANFQDLVDKITALEAKDTAQDEKLALATRTETQFIKTGPSSEAGGRISFNLSTVTAGTIGDALLVAADDTGSGSTTFTAAKACIVNIVVAMTGSLNSYVQFRVDNVAVTQGPQIYAANANGVAVSNISLNKGQGLLG